MKELDSREVEAPKRRVSLRQLETEGRSLITVEELAEALHMKRTATYDAVRRGDLPSLRLGRRLFIPVPALLKILEGDGQIVSKTSIAAVNGAL